MRWIRFQQLSNQNRRNWWMEILLLVANGFTAVIPQAWDAIHFEIASCSFGLQPTGYTRGYLFKVSIFLCVHPVRHGDALQCRVHHPGDNLRKERGGCDSWEVPPHGVRVCCESWQIVPVSVSQKFTLTLWVCFSCWKRCIFLQTVLAHQLKLCFSSYSYRMLKNLRILKFQSIGDCLNIQVHCSYRCNHSCLSCLMLFHCSWSSQHNGFCKGFLFYSPTGEADISVECEIYEPEVRLLSCTTYHLTLQTTLNI